MKKNLYVFNLLLVCALLLSSVSVYLGPSANAAPEAPDATTLPPPIDEFLGIIREDPAQDTANPNYGVDTDVPDTSGAAGRTHYLQAANTVVALYRKDGTRIDAQNFNTFWTLPAGHPATNTACNGANQAHHGQPQVIYDHMAHRWVVSDVAYANIDAGPYYLCVAVSQPLPAPLAPVTAGSEYFAPGYWYYYAIETSHFQGDALYPDAPKLGLWNNGYYMSVNLIDVEDSGMNRTARGVQVFALDRNVMTAGQALGQGSVVQFYLPETRNYRNLVPTNLLGVPPVYGTPNYFATIKPDKFYLWEFSVDWRDPSAATFGQALEPDYTLNTNTANGWVTGHTVPQLLTNERVEVHGERLTSPLQYRSVDGISSLWATHAILPDPAEERTGLRWYEIQFADTGMPNFYQTGAYAGPEPETDTAYRWLPSLAVDKAGDMVVGFSISDPDLYNGRFPSIHYAGRLRSSFSGALPLGEATLYEGTASQDDLNSIVDGPWGRQSHMSIDPLDECVFWYTNMYYDATAPNPNQNWQTRVGWFSLTECRGGMTNRVSLRTDNGQGTGASGLDFGQYGMGSVAISADGRYVAFASAAPNLVAGDTNNLQDVFIRDRDRDGDGVFDEPGAVETVRLTGPNGVEPNGHAWEVSMSSTGRYIAFSSEATNLVANDSNGFRDVFLYDRTTGVTERISVRDGTNDNGNNVSDQPFVSGDGRYVAFRSYASNLVPGDTNAVADIFIRSLLATPKRTYRVSVTLVGAQLTGESATPTLSYNGQALAFATQDAAFGAGDGNANWDVFVKDWTTGAVTPVSVASGGAAMGNGASYTPFISGDGQHVAFVSMATDLQSVADPNVYADIYVWDRDVTPAATQRVSLNFFSVGANGNSYSPSLTHDGRYIVFASDATNLDSFLPDYNNKRDIFLHDRSMVSDGVYDVGLTQRISLSMARGEPNNSSFGPMIAAGGRHVAYVSDATNLVTNDTNTKWDVFAYDSRRTLPILLTIPGNITGGSGNVVSVPVVFKADSQVIDTTVFSVDYDETCLVFENNAGDITWNLSNAFFKDYSFNAADMDGELDFNIRDEVAPRTPLPEGTLVTIRLRIRSTCAALPGSTNAARVGFSSTPAPSFGSEGESVKGSALDGFVTIEAGRPGDCNGDGRVEAGDLSAFVLEFFDGDDVSPSSVPGGTFPGNEVGCNPNRDNLVDAGDLSCTVLIIWGNGSAGCAGSADVMPAPDAPFTDPQLAAAAPTLSFPAKLPVKPGSRVTLPLTLTSGGAMVSSLVFSVDIDESWLTFDPADADHNGMPDMLAFTLPAGFQGAAVYDAADTDGELDIVVYDLSAPMNALPDGVILSLTLTAQASDGDFTVQVQSSPTPPASFGSADGLSLPGALQAGAVWISNLIRNHYTPLLFNR